jgi:acyl-homoserine lactone acylase PvdQ
LREASLGVSGIGPLEWYFNAPGQPAPGAAGAINNLYYDVSRAYPDPAEPDVAPLGLDGVFGVTNGPSVRLVVDLGDLDAARIVQTTGQAGNPFDRHYGDMVGPFLRGETYPLPFSPSAVAAAAVTTLVLQP